MGKAVSQPDLFSLPSLRGQYMSSNPYIYTITWITDV